MVLHVVLFYSCDVVKAPPSAVSCSHAYDAREQSSCKRDCMPLSTFVQIISVSNIVRRSRCVLEFVFSLGDNSTVKLQHHHITNMHRTAHIAVTPDTKTRGNRFKIIMNQPYCTSKNGSARTSDEKHEPHAPPSLCSDIRSAMNTATVNTSAHVRWPTSKHMPKKVTEC